MSGAYQLPFGKGKRYLQESVGNWLMGGWTVSGIFNRQLIICFYSNIR
jgi:hypothetical protein